MKAYILVSFIVITVACGVRKDPEVQEDQRILDEKKMELKQAREGGNEQQIEVAKDCVKAARKELVDDMIKVQKRKENELEAEGDLYKDGRR